jgi:membrane-bound ClpP family serine protease
MSALEIITFVLGVTIGLAAILISLGQHSADQWTMGMALLFVALNFIAYQLDSTGRLNLFIVWALFILIMALVYFISQKIPEKPLGGNYTGKTGVVLEGLFPQGKVKVDDEIWDAITVNDAIGKGSVVEIIEKDPNGLRLIVKEIKS